MTIYLLRHGYSEWQEHYDPTQVDPGIPDARLAKRGREQVRAAAAEVHRLGIELVVTSPLTRTIETALGLFEGASSMPVFLVEPLLRERLGDSCDIGRPPAELAAEFPALDFAHLDDPWWYQGEPDERGIPIEPRDQFERRAAAFESWLRSRTEQSILVVSHRGFLRCLGAGEIGNCELKQWAPTSPT